MASTTQALRHASNILLRDSTIARPSLRFFSGRAAAITPRQHLLTSKAPSWQQARKFTRSTRRYALVEESDELRSGYVGGDPVPVRYALVEEAVELRGGYVGIECVEGGGDAEPVRLLVFIGGGIPVLDGPVADPGDDEVVL